MEKHITLVAILNIVYRSLMLLGALVLLILAASFSGLIEFLVRNGDIELNEVPVGILHIVPAILAVVGFVLGTVSVLGIVGGIGLMKLKEWGRMLTLVVSFFNLLHVPLGTVLGAYSIWVLMNGETIKFITQSNIQPGTTT